MDRKGGPMSNPHTFFGQVGLFGGLIFRHIQLELPINGWLYLSLAGQISRFRQTHNTRYPKIWWISWSQFSPIYIAITWGSPPFSASCNGSRGQRSRPPASHRPRHAPCSCSRLKPPKATKLQRTQTWRRRRRNKWRSVFLWVWIYSFWISMEPWWYVFNGLARGFLQIFPSSKSGDMGMDIQIYDVRDMDIDAIRHCTYTKNGILEKSASWDQPWPTFSAKGWSYFPISWMTRTLINKSDWVCIFLHAWIFIYIYKYTTSQITYRMNCSVVLPQVSLFWRPGIGKALALSAVHLPWRPAAFRPLRGCVAHHGCAILVARSHDEW